MSHMRLVGVTEQQHSSCNRSLHSQYCNQSSPGNDSDQSPSHIGHCASFTTCLLAFLANFSNFLLSVLAFSFRLLHDLLLRFLQLLFFGQRFLLDFLALLGYAFSKRMFVWRTMVN